MKKPTFIFLIFATGVSLIYWPPILVQAKADFDNFPNEIPKTSTGSCLAAGLCCKGRDSSCVVQRALPNSIIEDLVDTPCYCDGGCVLLQDCCQDFQQFCGVQDCEVSGWGSWSNCDQVCGQGTMTRSRSVLRDSRNGGKLCPSMVQKRGCRGTKCRHHKNKITLEDTAVLLPIEFSSKRKMNASMDITKNLRSRYPKDPEKEKAFPYCVEFQVIRYTRACKSLESFSTVREGSRICVFCEEEAQKSYTGYRCAGSGPSGTSNYLSNGISTRFSSLREPLCHGKWKHVASSTNSNCPCKEGPKFIFI